MLQGYSSSHSTAASVAEYCSFSGRAMHSTAASVGATQQQPQHCSISGRATQHHTALQHQWQGHTAAATALQHQWQSHTATATAVITVAGPAAGPAAATVSSSSAAAAGVTGVAPSMQGRGGGGPHGKQMVRWR